MSTTFSKLKGGLDIDDNSIHVIETWRSHNWDYKVVAYELVGDSVSYGAGGVLVFAPNIDDDERPAGSVIKVDLTCVEYTPLVDMIANEIMEYIGEHEPGRVDLSVYLDKLRSGSYEVITFDKGTIGESSITAITFDGFAAYKSKQEGESEHE